LGGKQQIDLRCPENPHSRTELSCWALTGKLGYKTPQDTGSAYLNWAQKNSQFVINLSGPLGSGAVKIVGETDGDVTIYSGKKKAQGTDAKALFNQTFGWELPLPQLFYWIKGVAAPTNPIEQAIYNHPQELSQLSQGGWSINFSRYNAQGLPGKIVATTLDLQLIFIINEWDAKLPPTSL